ncbi:MAG: 50S ribosomal protein L21 [Candidatus Omnitrophica bacterium]|nr:50S ribosomal protein L21 [Candidatus Omnitrophota bacterium]
MYAIVEAGGRQWRVEPGTQLLVNQLPDSIGSQHVLERVLLTSDGTAVRIGRPYVSQAQVLCEVLEHRKGPKVITYKFRRRENYRRTHGHRQPLTRLLVKDIQLGS